MQENIVEQLRNSSWIQTTQHWIYTHPRIKKFTIWAFLFFGIALLLFSLFFVKTLLFMIIFATSGALCVGAAFITQWILYVLIPDHHDMRKHMFSTGEYAGATLYYDGDVPILSLRGDAPKQLGVGQGYLCGEAIHHIVKRFHFILYTLCRQPRASKVSDALSTFRKIIPHRYLEEIDGIAEGYRLWAKKHWWKFPISISADDILILHLLPDMLHYTPSGKKLTQAIFGCTAIAYKDKNGDVAIARNMDWPSLGVAGMYSLVIKRQYTDSMYHNTLEVSIPGLVGTITGMNAQGLSVAMNVCQGNTKQISGIPAIFYNRQCLEEQKTVQDVLTFLTQQSPLGPYHLTIADTHTAAAIHLFQGAPDNTTHCIRYVDSTPTASFNCCYNPAPHNDFFFSFQRNETFEKHLQEGKTIEEMLAISPINNAETVHSIIMHPRVREIQVAFDNAFAGSMKRHSLHLV